MKKTIKHPDGTEEVIEGTAEELAEYEKNLNESGGKKKKNPKILTDEVKRLADLLDDPSFQNELYKTLDEMKRVREDLANRPICAPLYVGGHCGHYGCPSCWPTWTVPQIVTVTSAGTNQAVQTFLEVDKFNRITGMGSSGVRGLNGS